MEKAQKNRYKLFCFLFLAATFIWSPLWEAMGNPFFVGIMKDYVAPQWTPEWSTFVAWWSGIINQYFSLFFTGATVIAYLESQKK